MNNYKKACVFQITIDNSMLPGSKSSMMENFTNINLESMCARKNRIFIDNIYLFIKDINKTYTPFQIPSNIVELTDLYFTTCFVNILPDTGRGEDSKIFTFVRRYIKENDNYNFTEGEDYNFIVLEEKDVKKILSIMFSHGFVKVPSFEGYPVSDKRFLIEKLFADHYVSILYYPASREDEYDGIGLESNSFPDLREVFSLEISHDEKKEDIIRKIHNTSSTHYRDNFVDYLLKEFQLADSMYIKFLLHTDNTKNNCEDLTHNIRMNNFIKYFFNIEEELFNGGKIYSDAYVTMYDKRYPLVCCNMDSFVFEQLLTIGKTVYEYNLNNEIVPNNYVSSRDKIFFTDDYKTSILNISAILTDTINRIFIMSPTKEIYNILLDKERLRLEIKSEDKEMKDSQFKKKTNPEITKSGSHYSYTGFLGNKYSDEDIMELN